MPSLKDLRSRIKSVKSTQQITKTMKMVAAAKMRRAEEACEQARPYACSLSRVLNDLATRVPAQGAPLMLRGHENPTTVRLIMFGSGRGLCGGFNGQLTRKAVAAIKAWEKQGKRVEIVTVGSKAYGELKNHYGSFIVDRNDAAANNPDFAAAHELADKTTAAFMAGDCHEVHLLFNEFVNVITQKPQLVQLLPFHAGAAEKAEDDTTTGTPKATTEYEPNEESLLAHMLPLNVSTQIFAALLESQASEQGARMSAMDSATRNAGEMIKGLSLTYNRQRQANITKEITEIVSGAEAV